jgi:hypothetical protein
MALNVKKINNPKNLTEALKRIKPTKMFNAKKHLGKVKWEEDPVEYQKRIRNEWD